MRRWRHVHFRDAIAASTTERRPDQACARPDHARLRRVAPMRASRHAVQLTVRLNPEIRVPRSPSGSPPREIATRTARHRACPGTVNPPLAEETTPCQVRLARPPGRNPVSSQRPTRVGRGARELDRWGARLVGLRLDRHGLGIPLAFTVTPPGGSGGLCRNPGPSPRVLHRARRTRLASVSSSSSSCQPNRTDCSACRPSRATSRYCTAVARDATPLADRTMSHSSFQRSPLHCIGSRGVHVPRARRRDRIGDRSPTRLVYRLRGLAPPWRIPPPRPCPGIAPGFQSWGS